MRFQIAAAEKHTGIIMGVVIVTASTDNKDL